MTDGVKPPPEPPDPASHDLEPRPTAATVEAAVARRAREAAALRANLLRRKQQARARAENALKILDPARDPGRDPE